LVNLLGGLEAQGLYTRLANMMNFTQIEQDELQLLYNEKKNNPGLQKCKYRTGFFISSKFQACFHNGSSFLSLVCR